MENCRICTESKATELSVRQVPNRSYLRCNGCESVFVKAEDHLDREKEVAVYKLHENSVRDPRYRAYLTPIIEMGWREIEGKAGSQLLKVLDFGSGPLAESEESMVCSFFREKGLMADAYDPYFRTMTLLKSSYDLIIACEVVEHFRDPLLEFKNLSELLNVDGVLAIQTEILPDIALFDSWYYRRDPTHVAFYSPKTFSVLATRLGFSPPVIRDGKRVLMKKFG